MFTQIELSALFNWAVLPTSDETVPFEAPELRDALTWALGLSTPDQNEVLAALSERLPGLNPAKASALLVLGGRLVEEGADPQALLPGGLAHLAHLQELYDAGQAPVPDSWRFTVIGLMALLTRSAAGRAQLQQATDLMVWLEEHEDLSDHFGYLLQLSEVSEVSDVSDEDVLWVLFPAYETGLEVSVSQLNNTFHLLTLLQPLVLAQAAALGLQHPGPPTDPAILRYARGETADVPEASDYARFEWLTALAYEGGPLASGQVAWGEAAVSDLPRVRGHVLLLATDNEKRLSRSWDAGFLATVHDANRPEVRLRRLLPAAEVRQLLHEIHPPVPAATPVAPPPVPTPRSWWQRLWEK